MDRRRMGLEPSESAQALVSVDEDLGLPAPVDPSVVRVGKPIQGKRIVR